MKLGFLVSAVAGAQTTQSYTGVIKDLTQHVVTSGQVTFTLTLRQASTIPGTGTFVPPTTLCNINANGTLSGYVDGVVFGPCIVTSNTSLTPTGTAYRICEQLYYSTPGSCFYDYALGGSKDISSIVPTLPTGPINYGGVPGPPGPIGSQGPIGAQTSGVNLTPSATQTVVQPSGTQLNINTACIGTDVRNIKGCFGAKGDMAIIGGCTMANGAISVACSSGSFTSADIGKSFYLQGAGAAGASLSSTIASVTNSTTVVLANMASTTVSGSGAVYGSDDTTALQNALNLQRSIGGALYLPAGNYLHHGLNVTGQNSKIYGDNIGASQLFAIAVTNPGRINSATTVGFDASGSQFNEFSGLAIIGGQPFLADLAPKVNFLGGRSGPPGTNAFAIAHVFNTDYFHTSGPYDVVLYGYEQTDFRNCEFQNDGTNNLGLLYLSANNTPGFTSPYVNLVGGPTTSTTKISVSGARTAFAAGQGNFVVLDQGLSGSNYAISLRDAYIVFNGTSGVFLSDTGSASSFGLRNITLDQLYAEGVACGNCQFAKIGAPAWNWTITNVQFYGSGTGLTAAPYQFANGFLDGYVNIDTTGSAGGIEFSSSSCLGSTLHLGQQEPATNCTDYLSASGVLGVLAQNTMGHIQASSAAWMKLGTYVGHSGIGAGPIIIFSTGAGTNSGANQQNTAILSMRPGNDTAAPNLSGISITNLDSSGALLGVKAVATGGSTLATNQSWDIYLNQSSFSNSTYQVTLPVGTKWIPSNTPSVDPGSASTTVVVGGASTVGKVIIGVTGALPGTAIAAGTCVNLTATMPGVGSGQVITATPQVPLNFGLHWDTATVSSPNTVTVPVCNTTASSITPSSTPTFSVRVIQ